MKRLRRHVAAIIACALLSPAVPASADAVTFWNVVTIRAVTIGRPGPVGFLDVALVHAALHDATQAFERRFEPYHVAIRDAHGSPDAAIAAAAHDLLVGLYPDQQNALDADYTAYLAARGLTGDAGVFVGQQAAAALLGQHRAPPSPPLPPYTGGTAIGMWRPTPSYIGVPPMPPPFSPMAAVYLAFTDPFTLIRPSQFRPSPPPRLTSRRYQNDYEEVKAYGARFNSPRTADQTDLAYFWTDNVVVQWNRALREIAEEKGTQLGDTARLFALANLATADLLISDWNAKLHHSFWRPVTAIHEGDADGNRHTIGDVTWEPLANTPNYPEYPSGSSGVAAAMTHVVGRVFGTDAITVTMTSAAPLAVRKTRTYVRLTDIVEDVVDARILLGIHFRASNVEGRRLGERVAQWTVTRFLRPVRGPEE